MTKKWMIILPSAVGDAVCASATINAILRVYPNQVIDVTCSENLRILMSSLINIDLVYGYEESKSRVHPNEYEWYIDLASDKNSDLLRNHIPYENYVCRSSKNELYIVNDELFPVNTFNKDFPGRSSNSNEPAWMLEAPLVAHVLNQNCWDWLNWDYEPYFSFKHPLAQSHSSFDVLLVPCGSNDLKKWPESNWIELCNYLSCMKLRLGVILGPSEIDQYAQLRSLRDIEILDNCSLLLMCSLFQKAKIVISNDCGPMHIAAACGSNLVSIFGPTNPEVWMKYRRIKSLVIKGLRSSRNSEEYINLRNKNWNIWPSGQRVIESLIKYCSDQGIDLFSHSTK